MWPNAFKHPSHTKRQMFFASWIFYWPGWFWKLKFCYPFPLPWLSSLLSSHIVPSSTVTFQSPPFCFPLNFTHNFSVITCDTKSVTVDVSHHTICFVLCWAFSVCGWHLFSIFIDTDDNRTTSRWGQMRWGGQGGRGSFEWIPGQAMTFRLAFGSLQALLSLKGIKHSGQPWHRTDIAIFDYICCLPNFSHHHKPPLLWSHRSGICPWATRVWLVKSVALSPGPWRVAVIGLAVGRPIFHMWSTSVERKKTEVRTVLLVSTSSETRLARSAWQIWSQMSDIRVVLLTGDDNVLVIYSF